MLKITIYYTIILVLYSYLATSNFILLEKNERYRETNIILKENIQTLLEENNKYKNEQQEQDITLEKILSQVESMNIPPVYILNSIYYPEKKPKIPNKYNGL